VVVMVVVVVVVVVGRGNGRIDVPALELTREEVMMTDNSLWQSSVAIKC
jgi:hypothetical protein